MPEPIKRTLADLCTEVFLLIIQLQKNVEYGDSETLRRRIKDLLDRLDLQARNEQIEVAALQQARFALVAFIDETILSSSWSQKGQWVSRTLNSEFYGKSDAGDEFFTRLNELRQRMQANAEVIKVYFQCLILGFKGRYFSKPDQLRLMMEDIYDSLRNLTDKHTSPDRIAPKPFAAEQNIEKPSSALAWKFIIPAVAAILLIFFAALKMMISSRANELF